MKKFCSFLLRILPQFHFVAASLIPNTRQVGDPPSEELINNFHKNLKDENTEVHARPLFPLLQTPHRASSEEMEISIKKEEIPSLDLHIGLPDAAALTDGDRGTKRLSLGYTSYDSREQRAFHQPASKKLQLDLHLSSRVSEVGKDERNSDMIFSESFENLKKEIDASSHLLSNFITGDPLRHSTSILVSPDNKNPNYLLETVIEPLAPKIALPNEEEAANLLINLHQNRSSKAPASDISSISPITPESGLLVEDFVLENMNRKLWPWISMISHE
ncbi:hypothetical protein PGT21_017682 [Puccinia graminis f. sp. tritici]|uniref:Uncharacterized protein n=1 Tax=Puccinia graminis f. sp. tritici TaxID=56615 RepID=A0A5B0QSJ7_PUCGR|nr:hypothetical protein PGT21_017682 [Puccinia graminis f. sp. tritici]KAA1115764.1 hypothetical protein PGTUg99_030907 [Puccinia graminis f. sp. tritici]